MLNVSQGVRSLSDFKTNTRAFRSELEKGEQAVILTVNGKAELAVMSAKTFQRARERLDQLDTLTAVKQALGQADRSKGQPPAEVFAALWKELRLPARKV